MSLFFPLDGEGSPSPLQASAGGPGRGALHAHRSFLRWTAKTPECLFYLRSWVTVEVDRAVLSEIMQIVTSAVRVLLTWESEHDVGSCQIHGA